MLTALFLFVSASAATSQQFEVRNMSSNELWYISLCETSYTRYSGQAVFTYTVDTVITGDYERGFVSLYYLNDSLVIDVLIYNGSLCENISDDFYLIYNINPDTDIAGLYTGNNKAKSKYTFSIRSNKKRPPEPSTKQSTETKEE